MLLSQLMFFAITCIFGLILDCILESIVFYITFQIIRRYAGGYHATTETRCEILSTLSILACIIVIKLSKIYDFQAILLFITFLASICIVVLCPLDTPEKPLSQKSSNIFVKFLG